MSITLDGTDGVTTTGLTSNGIDDNATSTAITIDSSENVGIGTSSPSYPLHIEKDGGGAAVRMRLRNEGTATNDDTILWMSIGANNNENQIWFGDVDDGNVGQIRYDHNTDSMEFHTNASERMRIDSSGNLLVGTTVAPTYGVMSLKNPSDAARWEIGPNTSGNFVVYNQSGTGVYLLDGGTSWTSTSDERLKENINDIGTVLESIKDYRCVNFSYKASKLETANSIGFIAQDWEQDFPNVVDRNDEGVLGIKYTETIPVLLKAIQELSAQVDELKAEVAALKGA